MARASVVDKTPQISTPVGSLKEIKDMQIPTRNICSCSEREDKKNAGCPVYDRCDRAFRDKRPENQLYRLTTAEGNTRVAVDVCFNVVRKEMDAEGKMQLIEVIGGEGDHYEYRGSRKLHPKRDPNCNECAQGKCEKWIDDEKIKGTVPVFPPAAEHPELVKFARKIEARKTGHEVRQAAKREALLGPTKDDE